MATGVSEIDLLLGGGFPIGGITELTGLASSGRTSIAFSLLAQASVDSACAYVDADDSVDPKSAAASGLSLDNLLWVRIASAASQVANTRACTSTPSPSFSSNGAKLIGQHCGGHHPRTETRGLGAALEKVLAQKADARTEKREGTPGHLNQKLSLAAAPDEQVHYEHCNARSADESDPIRQADKRAATAAREQARTPVMLLASARKQEKPWNRLERAIRASDQILQSGGFRVVVLDLAFVPQEQALHIPSATWFRFRRAAQESDAIFLLLTQVACARSGALCVLDCSVGLAHYSNNVLSGLSRSAEVARQRLSEPFGKKAPSRAVSWEATPVWMRAAGR
jgi:recombination protein RecA